MDYKLFPLESPSDAFINQLKAFCALDDVQREALAAWFQSTSDFNTYTPEAPQIIQASTLLPEQFQKGSIANSIHIGRLAPALA